jgi:hypothetical protein
MNAVLKIKSFALNSQLVEDIRQQAGQQADIEIRIKNGDNNGNWLTEEQFWALIDTLDWTKEGDDAAVIEPLISALAALPVTNIYRFQDLFSEKLWLLDTRRYAEASLDEGDDHISSDGFLYDRCCVLANGKIFYESVLKDPSLWPKGLSFERLLYVASEAYERKTGKKFTYYSIYNYETGSNEKGWE